MQRKTCAVVLIAALAAVTAASAQTADQLVDKNIQARGGRQALTAVKTLRMTGKMNVGPGMEAPLVMEMIPPDHKVRIDFTVQGMTGTQAYDGTSGWQVMPFMGKTEPEAIAADDLKDIQETADFTGPLFDYKDKGNKVEYLGKADLEGTPAQKLRLTEKSGDVTTIYLDGDSYLELKEESSRTVRGQAVELETVYGNYKQIGGITMPFSLEVKAKGKPNVQTITIDKIDVNPADVSASRFDMPKADKKPAPAAGATPPAAGATPPPATGATPPPHR